MPLCSNCHAASARPNHRYCADCFAAYMREWRKTHRLRGEARRKASARSYANQCLRRGQIKREPCEVCGSEDSQMHHEDYEKPLDVRWLCRPHHLALHAEAA